MKETTIISIRYGDVPNWGLWHKNWTPKI